MKRKPISSSASYQRTAKELQIHMAVADLLRFTASPFTLWYHPANEGKRSERTGAHLKRMGMLPGVADFALTLPDRRSAFLEIKTDDGEQNADQISFELFCLKAGILYAVARSLDEAQAILTSWGALRETVARAA